MDPSQNNAPVDTAATDSAFATANSPEVVLDLPEANTTPPPQPAETPTPASPEEIAQQRVSAAQRKMHELAQVAARSQQVVQQLLSDPRVAAALQQQQDAQPPYPGTPEPSDDAEIRQLLRDYKESKTEEEAFGKLLSAATKLARKDTEAALAEAQQQQQFQAQKQAYKGSVNQTVTQTAPDVPPEMFWAMTPIVEPHTPVYLTDPQERLAWQTQATIALCRQRLAPLVARTAASLVQNVQARQGMRNVMAPNSAAPRGYTVPGQQQPMSMVDQLKAQQAQQMERK